MADLYPDRKRRTHSDLIKKAGGITQFAYVKGAKLVRRANQDELKRMQDAVSLLAPPDGSRES